MTNLLHQGVYEKAETLRGTPTEDRYEKWLHSYRTCCLTGRIDIELAHTGDHRHGKAMARKAALWTVLPIARGLHHAEEKNRVEFWARAGFPDGEQIDFAARLFDIFEAGDDPSDLYADMQAQAKRPYLAQFL